MNLRSTIYSNTLIAAIVLQTLSAFCNSKFVNNVTKIYMYIVKQVIFNTKKLQCWTSAHLS